MNKISLQQVFSKVKGDRDPLSIGSVNDCTINLTKVLGSYLWHSHENRDKMILIVKGSFKISLEDQEIILTEGESLIIPRGIMHSAVAESEAWVLLIE